MNAPWMKRNVIRKGEIGKGSSQTLAGSGEGFRRHGNAPRAASVIESLRSYELVIPKVHAGSLEHWKPKMYTKKSEYSSTTRKRHKRKRSRTRARTQYHPLFCTQLPSKKQPPPFPTVSGEDAEKY